MRRIEAQTLFPLGLEGVATSLADEPVLIDGMRVLFDTKVALYPVTLRPDASTDTEAADAG